MSEKNAKEQRRMEQPVIRIGIEVYQDGRVDVTGFPTNMDKAISIMLAGVHRVNNHFVQLGKEGKLDEHNNIVQSRIVKPSPADLAKLN